MDLYITPEIVERKKKGKLATPFDLRAAQIIFHLNGRLPEVRINSEVKAIGKVKLRAGVSKKAGEPIYENEVEGLDEVNLTEEDDPDCGHATLIRIGDTWTIAFDFRYNKGLSKRHMELATKFLESAKLAFDRKLWAPFVDNLFSAAELSVKSVLLSLPDAEFRRRATHRAIHFRYNRFANLGNVNVVHKKTFNKLSGLRDYARYMKGEIKLTEAEASDMLKIVEQMLDDASRRISMKKSIR